MGFIFHIPHSSFDIPEKYLSDFALSLEKLESEKIKMTDRYTDELFIDCVTDNDEQIIFPVSRLLVDVERFSEDAKEPMAEIGMGMLYRSCHDLSKLRSSNAFGEELRKNYYDQHHEAFTDLVDKQLKSAGEALIIDCHSFPKKPLPYERNQSGNRPEICIGTDAFHTTTEIEITLSNAFREQGFDVDTDTPFSGSIVPMKFYQEDARVKSIMIEIRRDLYINETTGERNLSFTETKQKVQSAIHHFRTALQIV